MESEKKIMDLSSLKAPAGERRKRKRVGRGDGSRHGTFSTRGMKGQNSRSGSGTPAWFEGGQMPLQRRVPKRGFTNIFRRAYQVVNLDRLDKQEKVKEFTPAVMEELGLVRSKNKPIKILAKGSISRAITVQTNAVSAKAREAIEGSGGKVEVI